MKLKGNLFYTPPLGGFLSTDVLFFTKSAQIQHIMDASLAKSPQTGDLGLEPKNSQQVAELEFEKEQTSDLPVTSAFATLGRLESIRKFWRLFIFGLSVSISGM